MSFAYGSRIVNVHVKDRILEELRCRLVQVMQILRLFSELKKVKYPATIFCKQRVLGMEVTWRLSPNIAIWFWAGFLKIKILVELKFSFRNA